MAKDKILYRCWSHMKSRCGNPNVWNFHHYGGRGIKVSKRWLSFENFQKDMKPSWRPGLSIDRKNVNKGYSKSNCRWATTKEQARNTRRNCYLEYNGFRMVLSDWAKKLGVKRSTLAQRHYVYKWPVSKTLSFNQ